MSVAEGGKKGTPNKANAGLKNMILAALDKVGGLDYLATQAQNNPTAFLTLIGKVLPTTLASDAAQPLRVKIVKFSESDIVG